MNKRIIFKNLDGSIGIVIPSPKARGQILLEKEKLDKEGNVITPAKYRDENDIEFSIRIAMTDVPHGLDYRIVDASEIPEDRTFRDAWTDSANAVKVDMPKARQIHMNRIREKRNEKLAVLDIETLKGKDVQAQKQKLRDLPQALDLSKVKTPEELKALWPVELKD